MKGRVVRGGGPPRHLQENLSGESLNDTEKRESREGIQRSITTQIEITIQRRGKKREMQRWGGGDWGGGVGGAGCVGGGRGWVGGGGVGGGWVGKTLGTVGGAAWVGDRCPRKGDWGIQGGEARPTITRE